MPELPEVETIRRQILEYLPMQVEAVLFSEVSDSIVKDKEFLAETFLIETILRQGKVLRFMLDQDRRIISGLGMSGSWRISKNKIKEKHTHVQFKGKNKDGEVYLAYVDPRRFGNMHFLNSDSEKTWLNRLGPDVSTQDLNLEYLLLLKNKKPNKQIKPFLLEQNYFAGVGNYMASEICAHARVRPTRRMKSLTKKELEGILEGTKILLENTLTSGGTTFSGGYADAYGDKGGGVKNLVVFYQKECQLCHQTPVKKITLAGRGTYYCPSCQK